MKDKSLKYILAIFFVLIAVGAFANSEHTSKSAFNLTVTSAKPEAFFGSILTDEGLMEIHKKTPFQISLKTSEIRLMLSAQEKASMITVSLTKNDNNTTKPLMNGKGRSVVMCSSNNAYNGVNGCAMVLRAGT